MAFAFMYIYRFVCLGTMYPWLCTASVLVVVRQCKNAKTPFTARVLSIATCAEKKGIHNVFFTTQHCTSVRVHHPMPPHSTRQKEKRLLYLASEAQQYACCFAALHGYGSGCESRHGRYGVVMGAAFH